MSYKGNKSYLPSKTCQSCGKPMTWRKKWEKNWDNIKYCSEACRQASKKNTQNQQNLHGSSPS